MKKLIFALLIFGLSHSSFATDGYFSLGYGAYSKGLAGGGIGLPLASLVNGNPATLVWNGNYYSVGVDYFAPIRQYTVQGAPSGLPGTFGLQEGTVESGSNAFFIPHFAANWVMGEKSTIGLSFSGNGGMNTNYETATFYDQGSSSTGVNLIQLLINISYSYKFNDKHSIGIAAVVGGQQFEAKGISSFGNFSSSMNQLSNNGSTTSVGAGVKVGYFGKITDKINLSGYYQTKIYSSKFEDYAGLFAEQGGFDIPANWTVGVAYKATNKLRLAFDVKQIYYSDIPSIANPIDAMALPPAFLNPGGDPDNPMDYTPNPNHVPLGADDGSGFGWEDMMIFKFAGEFDVSNDLTLRFGVSHGNNPVPESEVLFNILAPGIIENHLSFGVTKKIGEKGNALSLSIHHAFSNEVTGLNPFDFDPVQAQQGNFVPHQEVSLKMHQWDVAVQYTF